MDDPGFYPFCDLSNPEHHPSVIVDFDNVIVLDSPLLSLLGMETDHHPVIPILSDSVSWNICKPFAMGIIVRVVGIAGMWGDQL